jgi:hypothetical protein
MRDELAAVCQYACIRKETAKAASVLILRFFHGYYPEEIAQVMRSNRSAIEKRLQTARNEAKLYVQDGGNLSFINQKTLLTGKPVLNSATTDMRIDLRRQIFSSCRGECDSVDAIRGLYTDEHSAEGSIDQGTAAHFVSCERCLDIVNSVLDLPPLANRYPLDTISRDPGKKGGPGGEGGSGAGGSGDGDMLDTYINRRDAHFHHQPRELCVSVNGQL